MALHKAFAPPLAPEFTFAGWTWPRYVATLPRGTLAQRLAKRREPPCTGGYYHAPRPDARGARGFYLGRQQGQTGDGQPGRAWRWADDVDSSIRHRGWYCDEDRHQTIRGVVLLLPHGRALAGWAMGEGMAGAYEPEAYDSPAEAARVADDLARYAAEREQEYQAAEAAREAAEEAEAAQAEED